MFTEVFLFGKTPWLKRFTYVGNAYNWRMTKNKPQSKGMSLARCTSQRVKRWKGILLDQKRKYVWTLAHVNSVCMWERIICILHQHAFLLHLHNLVHWMGHISKACVVHTPCVGQHHLYMSCTHDCWHALTPQRCFVRQYDIYHLQITIVFRKQNSWIQLNPIQSNPTISWIETNLFSKVAKSDNQMKCILPMFVKVSMAAHNIPSREHGWILNKWSEGVANEVTRIWPCMKMYLPYCRIPTIVHVKCAFFFFRMTWVVITFTRTAKGRALVTYTTSMSFALHQSSSL